MCERTVLEQDDFGFVKPDYLQQESWAPNVVTFIKSTFPSNMHDVQV